MSVGGENRGDKDPGATRPSVCNEEAERSCPKTLQLDGLIRMDRQTNRWVCGQRPS